MNHDPNVQEAGMATMVIKTFVAWGGVVLAHLGIERWSDLAAMLASIYSFFLICEFIVRKIRSDKRSVSQ